MAKQTSSSTAAEATSDANTMAPNIFARPIGGAGGSRGYWLIAQISSDVGGQFGGRGITPRGDPSPAP